MGCGFPSIPQKDTEWMGHPAVAVDETVQEGSRATLTEENTNPSEPEEAGNSAAPEAPPLVLAVQPHPDEKAAAKAAAQQKKRDESSEESPFSVSVGLVYDGPLDLLLDLIRKQDIDIYDIP